YPQIRLQRQTELLGFQQGSEGIEAQICALDQPPQTINCLYLIGADGASSLVRQVLGLGFKGSTYSEDWLVVDARNVLQPIDRIEFICDPKRPVPHMVAPGNRERWEFMLHPGESREAMLHPDKLRELLAPWVPAEQLELERSAVYRFHARVVERFQVDQVFLVGDAAHLTPPFVGQGLCAGLRDVANLGWKLSWVLQGRANPSILDSYDQERRPHAAAMIRLAKWMGKLVMPRSPLQAVLTHGLVRLLRLLPGPRALLDDLKIKPQNRFRHGLFQPGKRCSRLQRGAHFAQALLRNDAGELQLSDDVLGTQLCLVGFGIDPHSMLDSTQLARWQAAGGHCVQICQRGQYLQRKPGLHVWEDMCGAFVGELAPFAWLAVVRPDRTLLHDGPASTAAQLLNDSLQLLGSPLPQPLATACLAPE
ncbi:MAG: FAD-dependent monooxygenase, partial [Pseudomonas sp.]|uniref:FAD-dependent monooxygenase n=1 Tax=Pseudomonas sp. TaxID=306 RepID=UPI003BB6A7DE